MTLSTEQVILIKGLVYYYQGNFFYPLSPKGAEVGQVKRAVREFCKTHDTLIKEDRASPAYRNLLQLEAMGAPK